MLTRRTATVTMSAPEASCACTITACDGVLAGADDQARRERLAGDGKLSIVYNRPPAAVPCIVTGLAINRRRRN